MFFRNYFRRFLLNFGDDFRFRDRFRVMEEIFNAGLPPEIALYAYGSSTGNPVSG